jgi:hypothetical protein
MKPRELTPLLQDAAASTSLHATFLSVVFGWFVVFVGGCTFIIGSTLYFFRDIPFSADISAALYTIGSICFLSVDVKDFFSSAENVSIRINHICSMMGSTLYLIGSIGFFPAIYNVTDSVGIWGFILGSLFVGSSQLWKTYRIGTAENGKFSASNLINKTDRFTQAGVELNAGIGAWCFFIGTVMYLHGPLEGAFFSAIIMIWIAGSCFFLIGSLFLGCQYLIKGQ